MKHENPKDKRDLPSNQQGDANRDPITGAPGSHPVGTGLGAAGGGVAGVGAGAAAGAATGAAGGGPIGAAVGGVAGAVIGGAAGHSVSETVNPTHEGAPGARREEHDLRQFIDYEVFDMQDNKIGTLDCIWSDHRGEPAFIGVKTGWFFGKTHVVPAQKVQVSERRRRLRIPYGEQKVKDAPAYDANSELSPAQEREIWNYYGISGTAESSRPRENVTHQNLTHREETARSATARERAEIPLSEEQLKVGKREVEAGGVRLRKIVRTEVVNQPVELKREEVVIERVPAHETQSAKPAFDEQEEVYIPLRREEAVIEKEAKVREVVRATKTSQSDRQEVQENVRREDIQIDKSGQARERRGQRSPATEMTEREQTPRSQRRREG